MRADATPLWRRVLLAASLLAVASSPRLAAAQIDGARPLFVVKAAVDPRGAAILETVLRDAVSGSTVGLTFAVVARIDPGNAMRGSDGERTRPPLGRAFVDLSDPGRATVYIVDGRWERILVRHVPPTGNPDVVRETVARIVSTAVEALLAGSFRQQSEPFSTTASGTAAAGTAGGADPNSGNSTNSANSANSAGRIAPSPPPMVPAETTPETRPNDSGRAGSAGDITTGVAVTAASDSAQKRPPLVLELRIGAAYEVSLYAAGQTLVHGPALFGVLALGTAPVRPALWLTGQYRWPVVSAALPVGYRIDTTALRLLAGTELALGRRTTLELGAGLGLDFVRLEPRPAQFDDSIWIGSERSFLIGLGRVMAGVRWPLGARASAHAVLVADIDASRTRLLFRDAQGNAELLSLYPIRPGVALTVSVP